MHLEQLEGYSTPEGNDTVELTMKIYRVWGKMPNTAGVEKAKRLLFASTLLLHNWLASSYTVLVGAVIPQISATMFDGKATINGTQ